MGACCNRNAFTKLSPYIHLKKDTENYIKYIYFSVEVKCLYSWHSNVNNPSSIPQLIAYIPMSTSKLILLKELIFSSQSHPVPSNEWAVYYFFFIPSGVWPISCGHDGHRFQRIPLVYVLQRASNTKAHRECFQILKYPVLTWKLCTFALGEHNNGFPTLFLFSI